MLEKIKSFHSTYLSIGGFAINLIPFLLYMLLTKQQHDLLSAILPFAIFYSFRRTTLFVFRGNPDQEDFFGKLGASAALTGYVLGLGGQLSPILWDLSAVGAGIGAACFPSVQKLFVHRQAGDDKANGLAWLIAIILLMAVIFLTINPFPAVSFALMIFYTLVGLCGFIWDPQRHSNDQPVTIHWPNLLLSFILFAAIFLVRLGRSLGVGQPAKWGIGLLAVALLVILLGIISSSGHSRMPQSIRLRLMSFGICADFCSIFSAIYIGVCYGVNQYLWIIAAYVAGALFGQPMIKFLHKYIRLRGTTLKLLGTMAGVLITFIYPLYFLGIFLMRSFASSLNKDAIQEYQTTISYQHDNIYMINYRLMGLAGLTVQFIMWVTLLISLLGFKGSLGNLFAAYTFHRPTTAYFMPILITHIVLACFICGFLILTMRVSNSEQDK